MVDSPYPDTPEDKPTVGEWGSWQETSTSGDENAVYYFDFDEMLGFKDEADNRSLQVMLTPEGIIIDAYDDGGMNLTGTFGATFDELYEWLQT